MRIQKKNVESLEFLQEFEAQAIMLSKLFSHSFYVWACMFA